MQQLNCINYEDITITFHRREGDVTVGREKKGNLGPEEAPPRRTRHAFIPWNIIRDRQLVMCWRNCEEESKQIGREWIGTRGDRI